MAGCHAVAADLAEVAMLGDEVGRCLQLSQGVDLGPGQDPLELAGTPGHQ